MEQLVSWHKYTHHLATLAVLALLTAMFVSLGFLPLVDNFFQVVALLSGAVLCPLLLRPQVGSIATVNQYVHMAMPRKLCMRLQEGSRWGWQAATSFIGAAGALAVTAVVALGVVALLKHSAVGPDCTWCPKAACIPSHWWSCIPEASASTAGLNQQPACTFSDVMDAKALVTCPSVRTTRLYALGLP